MSRSWTLRYDARPTLLNQERAGGKWSSVAATREWREAFHLLALEAKVPKLQQATVEVRHTKAGKGKVPDVCACVPSVKAAVDGMVDAGVLPDDTPKHLLAVTFHAPVRGETDSLELVVSSVCGGV